VKIAFISPCGGGNLGDAAIHDAFMSNLVRRLGPETRFLGITQNPEDTRTRHGIAAAPMESEAMSFSRPGADPVPAGSGRRPAPSRTRRRLRWLRQDLASWRVAIGAMRDVDALAVPGGGQLDDYWGGPWRTPYAIFKWTLLARLRRLPFVVLSVGAGTVEGGMGPRMTRFFLRQALRSARYVSYRDSRTAGFAAAAGLSRTSRIVPDVAFGHEARLAERGVGSETRTVALSPISYLNPACWPIGDADGYPAYVERATTLACLLRDAGFRVLLCTSDGPDRAALADVLERIEAVSPGSLGSGEIASRDTPTNESLFACFDESDVVVASRLHGLILANLRGKPTVALSYDWKVDEHMRQMGLERYVRAIDSFDPAETVTAVERAYADRASIGDAVLATCARFDVEVQRQFDAVVGLLQPTASGERATAPGIEAADSRESLPREVRRAGVE
jgi:polysaccharide pyruvyl transferase WcaK-like protein